MATDAKAQDDNSGSEQYTPKNFTSQTVKTIQRAPKCASINGVPKKP